MINDNINSMIALRVGGDIECTLSDELMFSGVLTKEYEDDTVLNYYAVEVINENILPKELCIFYSDTLGCYVFPQFHNINWVSIKEKLL